MEVEASEKATKVPVRVELVTDTSCELLLSGPAAPLPGTASAVFENCLFNFLHLCTHPDQPLPTRTMEYAAGLEREGVRHAWYWVACRRSGRKEKA